MKKLSSKEFKLIRLSLGLGVAAMGRALGISRQTIYCLEAGLKPITQALSNATQWMAEVKRLDGNSEFLPKELKSGKERI